MREKQRGATNTKGSRLSRGTLKRNISLYIMLIIPFAYFGLFKYAPIYGISAAFKDYNIFLGLKDSPWVGLKHFRRVFSSPSFFIALKNTIILNLGDLLFTFPVPIFLAILLNELKHEKFSKNVERIMYLPHFLSMVIIAGIVYQVFSPSGFINALLGKLFGTNPIPFLTNPVHWRITYWFASIWMGAGYGMIIYLAAMGGINRELYDAAYIDGAGRFGRIYHVTLPQLKPTIITMVILNVGKILSIGFERPFLLGNVLVDDASLVISVYVYKMGLQAGMYDYATAVGLFQSVVGLIMVVLANSLAKKMGEEGLF
ncbi:MAG TPA: ABC transporter permease subunit [Sphaerochaeta sp.]|nr:ABC transporter permease subunit [Sphaerochaeta sp.]